MLSWMTDKSYLILNSNDEATFQKQGINIYSLSFCCWRIIKIEFMGIFMVTG
uniref:Uncharacterized protein n=1 Tax=Lepeophtheirus salmonis TaxID=72036 RepID=A0A0K2SWW3_LEPSM